MDKEQTQPEEVTKPKWGPIAAVLVTLGVFFGGSLLGRILITFVPGLWGVPAERIDVWLKTSTVGQFTGILVVHLTVLALLWWYLKRRKISLQEIALIKPHWRDPIYAVIGFFAYVLLNVVFLQLAMKLYPGLDLNEQQDLGFSRDVAGPALVLIGISLVLFPPLVEETVFRGFLYTGLRTKLGVVTAALVTSAIFALAHLQGGVDGALVWTATIDTFALSLVLVYLRQKTNSLWPPICLHAIKNGIAFTALFILKIA